MAAPDVLIGDRYRLVRELGSGGMSVVWEAQDERLHRRVAVKQLRFQPGLSDDEARSVAARAMREARINARLQHPNAVAIFDVVEHEGRPCLVMEMVSSRTLADAVQESPTRTLPPTQVAAIASQVAGALAAAHGLGIVHRDIKPSNILLGADGRARISDFGISRATGDSTLTVTGMISGTPAYLAPEVARGHEPTSASDVFSLGATLYAALEGSPPFGTDGNAIALLHKVAEGSVPTPRGAGELAPLLTRMLGSEPGGRPAMDEVATVLAELSSSGSDPLGESRTDESTVAIPPPTGAIRGGAAGTALGPGESGNDPGTEPTTPPTAATPLPDVGPPPVLPPDPPSVGAQPSAEGPRTPQERGARRGWISATVVVVVVAVAAALVGLLWPRPLGSEPGPDTGSPPAASQQRSGESEGKESAGPATEGADPGGTEATKKPSPRSDSDQSTEAGEPTETSEPAPTSEKPEPTKSTESKPGQGNEDEDGGGDGNGDGGGGENGNENGNGNGDGGGDGNGNG
jgi:serine/threonine protein kinase